MTKMNEINKLFKEIHVLLIDDLKWDRVMVNKYIFAVDAYLNVGHITDEDKIRVLTLVRENIKSLVS